MPTRRSLENRGISDKQYINIMERVAEANYKDWGFSNSDAALFHALNDNTYDYRGYYNKYPNSRANADTHWTDEFKTVYHPTFSDKSRYSGKKSQYNPKGIRGGHWYGDVFVPSIPQLMERRGLKNGGYLTRLRNKLKSDIETANNAVSKHKRVPSSPKPVTTGGAGYVPPSSNSIIQSFENGILKSSRALMSYIQHTSAFGFTNPFTYGWKNVANLNSNPYKGPAQDTFLTPRFIQEREFLRRGYIKGKEGDYGLVKKAVGDKKYPIYQRNPDAISRDKLIVLGNTYNSMLDYDKDLEHANSAPTAVYTDGQGNFYQKAWDLNDYGGSGGSTSSLAGDMLDFIGNPVVVTTGFQKIGNHPHLVRNLTPMMNKKGLVPTEIDGNVQWTLPEVVVTHNRKKRENGGINIAPSKRGTFTAAASKHGMGVQEFASKVLRNKDSYSPAMVKKRK